MAFSTGVADQALTACARHCCLCHKFCGTNIELHHIEQRADGGADSFENCIPLCFDCHAEVGHYNPRHPKGRKFTPDELRAHRDIWYKKVESNPGPIVDEQFAALDRDVISRLQGMLPRNGNLGFVRGFDYGGAFDNEAHDELRAFLHEFQGPEFEFMDADLEGACQSLRTTIGRFLLTLDRNTWDVGTGTGVRSLPDEWKWKSPERWEKVQADLNGLADDIGRKYDGLIRMARIKLGVLSAA